MNTKENLKLPIRDQIELDKYNKNKMTKLIF